MTGSQTPAQTVKSDPSNFENRNRLWIGTSLVMTGNILSFAAKLIARRGLTPNQLTDPSRFILQIEWAVILSVLVLGVVFFVERLPASSIGIRRLSWTDTMLAVAFYMFGRQVYAFLGPVAGRLGLSYIPIRILDSPPLLEWTSVIAASVSEESSSARRPQPRARRAGQGTTAACASPESGARPAGSGSPRPPPTSATRRRAPADSDRSQGAWRKGPAAPQTQSATVHETDKCRRRSGRLPPMGALPECVRSSIRAAEKPPSAPCSTPAPSRYTRRWFDAIDTR